MSVDTLLRELKVAKVKLQVKEGKLICELPKSGIQDDLKRRLIENKEALKQLLLELQTTQKETKLSPRDRGEPTPLSYAQQTLWLAQKLDDGEGYYNSHFVFKLTGELDQDAFQSALRTVIKRHETLRTCYFDKLGVPYQEVMSMQKVDQTALIEQVDMRLGSENQLYKAMLERISIGFDLAEDLPLRLTLFQVKDGYVALLVVHHIATDGSSGAVFSRELCHFYMEEKGVSIAPLPPLDIQYGDFASWQRSEAWQKEFSASQDYWLNRLQNLPDCHQLPLDLNRPKVQQFAGRQNVFPIEQALVERLNTFAKSQGMTLFMVMHTVLGILMAKYSGQKDIMIGVPIANRRHSQLAELIGFFVNSLPTRIQIEDEATFESLLKENKANLMSDFAHQEYPTDKLVEELEFNRLPGVAPLFQVLFVMQNTAPLKLKLPGAEVEPINFDAENVRFDIELYVSEENGQMELCWKYATSLFKQESIERLNESFMEIIYAVLDNAQAPLTDLNVIGERQNYILQQHQKGPRVDVKPLSLQARFEENAQLYPERVALEGVDCAVTYGELDKQANQLAHYLRAEAGVKTGDLVGFSLSRGPAQIIAILAILKAGAGYLPLDVTLPEARVEMILSGYPSLVVLTDNHVHAKIEKYTQPLLLDALDLASYDGVTKPVQGEFSELPCYVLHTSGSTGRPKAVQMSHGPLINLVETVTEQQPLFTRKPVWVQFASIGFDISAFDVFASLGFGGKLILLEQDKMNDPEYLGKVVQKYHVNVLNLPYSMLRSLCFHFLSNDINPKSLNCIISTAEQLKITQEIKEFFSRNTKIQLVNQYGPSETHVTLTANLPKIPEMWPELPTVGVPIGNTECYILDKQGLPVPIGVTGELYFTGECLSDGYLNNPEQQAYRFVENHINPTFCETMYRTGDLARWNSNGSIEYLGRIDKQVKIRGFRIEIGEVETAIESHPEIEEAVVISVEWQGSSQLVAFFRSANTALDHHAISVFLQQKLPHYMCPALCDRVERFETNTNGKIDKSKLPEPDFSLSQVEYVAPQTVSEERMQKAWQKVLEVEKVGREDNFFALGGHSILAAQLSAGIQLETGVKLPVRVIIENPLLKSLASKYDEAEHLLELKKQKANQTIKATGTL